MEFSFLSIKQKGNCVLINVITNFYMDSDTTVPCNIHACYYHLRAKVMSKSVNQKYLIPVKRWGNLIGRITASFSASLAPSKPATSLHLMLGFSMTIAPGKHDTTLLRNLNNITRTNLQKIIRRIMMKLSSDWINIKPAESLLVPKRNITNLRVDSGTSFSLDHHLHRFHS